MVQTELPMQLERKKPEMMQLLQFAIEHNSAIDVIERLSALQENQWKRDAEIQFNLAMNAAQSEIGRIAPDATNKQTNSKWATYAALDRALRPIYVKHGFSLSFDSGDSSTPETVVVFCYLSHAAGHTRKYQSPPIPADGKGAKGNDVMTKAHATGAAMSYGMRYLLKYIFNIAVGEEDNDGNITNGWLSEKLEWIDNCTNPTELQNIFTAAYNEAKEHKADKARLILIDARAKKKADKGW